jgi:Mn-dependent DtxR family transcriptional regulator
MYDNQLETFQPTEDELETLTRLSVETITVHAALVKHLPIRLYELGYITTNSEGRLMLTDKGLGLIRHQ